MTEASLAEKLRIKPGYRILVFNAPDGYLKLLYPLPSGVEIVQSPGMPVDLVHLFVGSQEELESLAPQAMEALKPGGLLWISYPKRSSDVETDISRDVGWDTVLSAGWQGVAQVSVDDTWSALRFKQAK
jgi:hypothetical protein